VIDGVWVLCNFCSMKNRFQWYAQIQILCLSMLLMASCGTNPDSSADMTDGVLLHEALGPNEKGGENPDFDLRPEVPPLIMPDWFESALKTPVGDAISIDTDDTVARQTLAALGFSRAAEGRYVRQVNLLDHPQLVPSIMAELPEIDTIAMISIFRPQRLPSYIYATLRDLFRELPQGAEINVLVGDADTSYLSIETLAQEIGAQNAEHVHIIPAPTEIAAFFIQEETSIAGRATWNYARALRSYAGKKKFLLLEDDLALPEGGLANIAPWLSHSPVNLMTLYNDRCWKRAKTLRRKKSTLMVQPTRIQRNDEFPTTQAIIFDANMTYDAGTYIQQRAGRESYDYMLGRFFAQAHAVLGYVYPSIVQHEGRTTTGLSGGTGPYSDCMYPAPLRAPSYVNMRDGAPY
jgi:hypothetical protein